MLTKSNFEYISFNLFHPKVKLQRIVYTIFTDREVNSFFYIWCILETKEMCHLILTVLKTSIDLNQKKKQADT